MTLTVAELRKIAGLPSFTAGWEGNKTDRGWPPCGIQIRGTDDVSLIAYSNASLSCPYTQFQGFTYTRHHYCPSGPWADWVKLARKILEVNKIVEARQEADYLVESLG